MSHEMEPETREEFNKSNNSSSDKKNSSYEAERSRSRERCRKRTRRERERSASSRSRSRSPARKRTRYNGTREKPEKSRVLGVFGLSSRTIEDDLVEVFSYYGAIRDIRIIYDAKTGYSRGFGFIYYHHTEDASDARRHCNGMRLCGKRIRVDYSITRRPHTPTPGIYMGRRSDSRHRHRDRHGSHHRRSRSYTR